MTFQRKPEIPKQDIDSFIHGAKDALSDKQQNKMTTSDKDKTGVDSLRKQTYYISELYILAIHQMAFHETMDISEVVRNALEQYIPEVYVKQAREKAIRLGISAG